MTVTVYHSTDASAPVLNSNAAGALITVLDAILVNGYGSKAPVGWTKPYSGTNLAAYRQSGVGGSNRMYLRVDDTNAQVSRIVAYESMSAISTGIGAFPTETLLSGGGYIHKANGASLTRAWFAVSNGKMFYFVNSLDGTWDSIMTLGFGDFNSYKVGDAYNTILMCSQAPSTFSGTGCTTSLLSGVTSGHYVARSHTQLGNSIPVGKHTDNIKTGSTNVIGASAGHVAMPYPHSLDGLIYQAPIWVHEYLIQTIRGELPGQYAPLHDAVFTSGTIINGTGIYAGKTFEVIGQGATGQSLFEISDTW